MKYIPELDGIRGFAAIAVVALHWNPAIFFWGWAGVNLFFVLSGFLIGRIILDALDNGRFSFLDFFFRRALRIWPAYYASLLAILAYYLFVDGISFFESRYFADWLRSLVFLQFTPHYLSAGADPYEMFDFLPGMLPVWSLAVEEQFYLFLPLLLSAMLAIRGRRYLIITLLVLAALAPIMRYQGFAPVLLVTQIDGLMFGVVLAAMNINERGRSVAGSYLALVVYCSAIALAAWQFLPYLSAGYRDFVGPEQLFADPMLWTWANLFFFGCIGVIVRTSGAGLLWVLRSSAMIYFGSISYAIYLYHFPLLAFVKPRLIAWFGFDYKWLALGITLLLIIGLSHLSRQYLERPILLLKHSSPFGRRARLTTGTA